MTDDAFYNELWIACYRSQIDGYPLGHPNRINFKPIVPVVRKEDRTYNREKTLMLSAYGSYFTDDQKQELLKA